MKAELADLEGNSWETTMASSRGDRTAVPRAHLQALLLQPLLAVGP